MILRELWMADGRQQPPDNLPNHLVVRMIPGNQHGIRAMSDSTDLHNSVDGHSSANGSNCRSQRSGQAQAQPPAPVGSSSVGSSPTGPATVGSQITNTGQLGRPGQPAGGEHPGAQRTYESAVANGFYLRDQGGLAGKTDNVRRYWEDQINRYDLHDFIGPLVERKKKNLSRIRVLDLGAGAGEGYEVLTNLRKEGDSLRSREIDVLPEEMISAYTGLDISPAMVRQARASYDGISKVHFEVADLGCGLGPAKDHLPYDLYFSSYASLSHLTDDQLRGLIEEMVDHAPSQAIFVADLLGRYSYEWPCYWSGPEDPSQPMRPYSMSYLYPASVRDQISIERFPVRFWGGQEFDEFFTSIAESRGAKVRAKKLSDRSVLVGRHVDTAEYNPSPLPPIRQTVNRLYEQNVRTDLTSLIFDYSPRTGFDQLNAFFEKFQMAWNAVVYEAMAALEHYDDREWLDAPLPEVYPRAVQDAIGTLRGVVGAVQWFRMGDPRANVVEPQLGYILRNLEMDLQEGLGAAHGLLAVYEFTKD